MYFVLKNKMISFELSPLVRQCLFVIAANLSALGAGLGIAWSSPMMVKLSDAHTTTLSRVITEEEATWLASIVNLLCIPSVLLSPALVNWAGRRNSLLISYFPKLVTCLMLVVTTEVWVVMLARLLEGISLALVFVACSTYTTEIADKKMRGTLGSLIQIFSSLGVVGMMCVGPFLSCFTLNLSYTGVMILSFLPLWFLPESPYFLYSKGRTEESIKVLESLRRSKDEIREELDMFAENMQLKQTTLWQAWKKKTFLKGFGIACFLGIGSQMTGYNFVALYFQKVMESTNTIQPEMASLVYGMVQLTSSIIPSFTTDRFGRKPILCVTLAMICLGMGGMGIFFWLKESGRPMATALNYLPLTAMIIINIGYSSGIGSIFFILLPELFDGPERALGFSSGLVCLSLGAFIISKVYSALLNGLGAPGTYWMFSVCSALICLFVPFGIPETKGKMFTEIQEELDKKTAKEEKK